MAAKLLSGQIQKWETDAKDKQKIQAHRIFDSQIKLQLLGVSDLK